MKSDLDLAVIFVSYVGKKLKFWEPDRFRTSIARFILSASVDKVENLHSVHMRMSYKHLCVRFYLGSKQIFSKIVDFGREIHVRIK